MTKITIKQKKRRIVSQKECETDLKKVFPKLFKAFNKAVKLYGKEIAKTPYAARVRNQEATYLNSKILQCIQEIFPDNWYFGKYKRFVLRINGYQIMVKKLDSHDKPMNIRTKNSDAIQNQIQPSLFEEGGDESEPILFFGYRRNNLGEIISPRLVFIDEGEVKWLITEDELKKKSSSLPINKKAEGEADVALRNKNKDAASI